MRFDQPLFVGFLVIVFTLYWLPIGHRTSFKHWVLLLASYVFYGWWDWRYLGLIIGCSLVAFYCALGMDRTASQRTRRGYWLASIIIPLAILVVFKYYGFFVGTAAAALARIGLPVHLPSLHVLLPIGISFYTFQALSYTTDVYHRRIAATGQLVPFLAFKAFFPQLVAGPIERAPHFLPQVLAKRGFSYPNAVLGCKLMLLGAFKKMVVADRLAPLVEGIFDGQERFSGPFNVMGACFFALQIYCDFSGYSDIARGVAKLFNLDLMVNFGRPYFARSLRDFWGHWHISLSTWFRDYVYIPLGGDRGTRFQHARNLLLTFLLSGLWHGADRTFLCWGAYHGTALLLERWCRAPLERLPAFVRWGLTLSVVLVGWIIFRADDMPSAWHYLTRCFRVERSLGLQGIQLLQVAHTTVFALAITVACSGLVLLIDKLAVWPRAVRAFERSRTLRYAGYAALVWSVLFFGVFMDQRAFIYFQF